MVAEFDCVECGEHIICVTLDKPPEFRLCGYCLLYPGWFRDPAARASMSPAHDGREAWEREAS